MPIDQQKLNKEFVFEGQGTAAELAAGLDQAAAIEGKLKARAKRLRWWALGAFPIFSALAIFVGPLLFIVAVIVSITLFVKSFFIQTIQKQRIELVRRTLNTLGRDAGPRARFTVKLRLRAEREKLSEGPNPRFKNGKQTFLQDAWLTLSGRMADGTTIDQAAVELVRQRTKRNPRGKTKTKERVVCVLRIRFIYNPAMYGDASFTSRVKRPFHLPEDAKLKSVIATNKHLTAKLIVSGELPAEKLHAASEAVFLGGYRMLNLARRKAVATGGTVK